MFFRHHGLAAVPTAGFSFDPNGTITTLQAVGLGVIALALICVTAIAIFGPSRKGNIKKSFDISASTIISLFPLFIVIIGVSVFAGAFFGWFG